LSWLKTPNRKGFIMTTIYCHEFRELRNFFLSDVKEKSGRIVEAVLNIDSCSVKHKLTLESPTVPSLPSTTVRDLFSDLTPQSVDSFKVFGEQYNSDVLCRIEIWDKSGITDNTIHCTEIQGLPPKEDKKG